MEHSVNICERVYWIGVNDRRKHLFENIWPIPNGISHNSYLIADEKSALVDTLECGSDTAYLARIESLLGGRKLDYLIINHMEPDHSGEIEAIVRHFPGIKIVGNLRTFKILESYYGPHCTNLHEVKEGDMLDLGHHKLRFFLTPWVHWPETMMTYDETEQILFSADAFGTFGTLDGGVLDSQTRLAFYEGEMRRYYSNIVGKYSGMVQKALEKLKSLAVSTICPLHGPVWRENMSRVVTLYDRWSRYEADPGVTLIYASMYGSTARMADYIAGGIAREGVRDIRVYDVSKTHISYLIDAIWEYDTVVLGSCAYNTQMFPLMEQLCRELTCMGVQNKALGIFGSFSWNGGGVRNLQKFAEEIGWPLLGMAEIQGRPDASKYAGCDALAKAMAAHLLKNSV